MKVCYDSHCTEEGMEALAVPESYSSNQGFNLKRWTVLVREMRQPLIFLGLPLYFKFKILFYTFTKTLGQRFDIFSSLSPRFIISINHCCSSNWVPASVILSGISLIIYYPPLLMCPIVNLWLHCNSCYIPQFTTYLSKSCLPLTSWAHYLLKRLLAIVSLKIPNFYKL